MIELLPVMSIISASQEYFDAYWTERENPTIMIPAKSPSFDESPILIIKITPKKQAATETMMMLLGWTYLEMMTAQNLPTKKQMK